MIWIALSILLATLVAAGAWASQKQTLRSRRRRRVLVTLKSGESFAGVLAEADAAAVVLREAVAVAAGPRGDDAVVDGELLVLTPDVAYVQFP